MQGTQRTAEPVDANPVIPKFEMTVDCDQRHMAARAIGLALVAAHVRRRMIPGMMAPDAHGAVICRVVAPHRLMWIMTGNAGQSGRTFLRAETTREERRLVANTPRRIPVECRRFGTCSMTAAAKEIQTAGWTPARVVDQGFG